jgi:hypothetical protein
LNIHPSPQVRDNSRNYKGAVSKTKVSETAPP